MNCKLHRTLEATDDEYVERIGLLSNLWWDFWCGAGDVLRVVALIGFAIGAVWFVRMVVRSFREDPKGSSATLLGILMVPYMVAASVGATIGLLFLTKEWKLPGIVQVAIFPVGIWIAYVFWEKLIIPIQEWLDQSDSER